MDDRLDFFCCWHLAIWVREGMRWFEDPPADCKIEVQWREMRLSSGCNVIIGCVTVQVRHQASISNPP